MAYEAKPSRTNETYSSGKLNIPVDAQRELGICLDDEVKVTVHGLDGYIETASFTGPVTSGGTVTIPSDFADQVGLNYSREYEFEFEHAVGFEFLGDEEDEEPITEEEIEEEASEIVDELMEDLEDDADEEEAEDEGLGRLFQ